MPKVTNYEYGSETVSPLMKDVLNGEEVDQQRKWSLKLKIKAYFPILLFARMTCDIQSQYSQYEELNKKVSHLKVAHDLLQNKSHSIFNSQDHLNLQGKWICDNDNLANYFIQQSQDPIKQPASELSQTPREALEFFKQIFEGLQADIQDNGNGCLSLKFCRKEQQFGFEVDKQRFWGWLEEIESLPLNANHSYESIEQLGRDYMLTLLFFVGSINEITNKDIDWHDAKFNYYILPEMLKKPIESEADRIVDHLLSNEDADNYEFLLFYLVFCAQFYSHHLQNKKDQLIKEASDIAYEWQKLVTEIGRHQQQSHLTQVSWNQTSIFADSSNSMNFPLQRSQTLKDAIVPGDGLTYQSSTQQSIKSGESIESQLQSSLNDAEKRLERAQDKYDEKRLYLAQLQQAMASNIKCWNDLEHDREESEQDEHTTQQYTELEEERWVYSAFEINLEHENEEIANTERLTQYRNQLFSEFSRNDERNHALQLELSCLKKSYDSLQLSISPNNNNQ